MGDKMMWLNVTKKKLKGKQHSGLLISQAYKGIALFFSSKGERKYTKNLPIFAHSESQNLRDLNLVKGRGSNK